MTSVPVRIMINAQYEQAFENRKFFRGTAMEKTREMNITDFCEKFDTVDPDTVIICGIGDKGTNMFTKCRKQNMEFWAMNDGGLRFFIDGADISSNGIILEAVKCVITEDNVVLNYDICNKSNKILLSIGVMRL